MGPHQKSRTRGLIYRSPPPKNGRRSCAAAPTWFHQRSEHKRSGLRRGCHHEAQDFDLSANLAGILQSGAFPTTPSRLFSAVDRGCLLAVGRNKIDRWHVTDNAVYVFETEYKLPVIDPWLAAYWPASAEHFALLLVIGFASRKAALTLLGMKRRHRDLRLSRCLAEPRHLGRLLPRHHRRRARKTIHRSFHRPSHRRHDLRAKLSALGRSGGCSNGAGRHRKSRKSGTC